MKRMRRWISLLLTMAMILSAVPAFPLTARAAGSGTSVLTYEDYTYRDGAVHIVWKSCAEPDLSYYQIYRKTAEETDFAPLAECGIFDGQIQYSYADTELESREITYIYKLESIDIYGNKTSVELPPVHLEDRSKTEYYAPMAVLSCDSEMVVGNAYLIDGSMSIDDKKVVSWFFDFGDGTTSTLERAAHTYEEVGEYTITLTVTNEHGLTSTVQKKVLVLNDDRVGTVTVRVVDTKGMPIPGASVYFDMGENTETVKTTNNQGVATYTASTGLHTVGAIMAEQNWLPTHMEVNVRGGLETQVELILVKQPMISATFTSHRMSYEELEAAGLDPNAEENRYVFLIHLEVVYEGAPFTFTLTHNAGTGETSGGGFTYDPEGSGWGSGLPARRPGGGGHGQDDDDDDPTKKGPKKEKEPTREVVPVVTETISGGMTMILMDIPIEASFLKEFFHVGLHLVNNASDGADLVDNTIVMCPPSGLSIPATDDGADELVLIDKIPANSSSSVFWYLRGDEPGEYDLEASYSARVAGFDQEIRATFKTPRPIKVYGLEAVQFSAEVIDTLQQARKIHLVLSGAPSELLDKAEIGRVTVRIGGE